MENTPDWVSVRNDFPAAHKYCYLSVASGGPMARPVYEECLEYYYDVLENGDFNWRENLQKREEARARVASLINADTDEIEFISSTSFGMNLLAGLLSEKGDVIASRLEFPSTTLPWLNLRRDCIRWVQPDKYGATPISKYCAEMDSKTGIILCSHVQFSNGFRQDLHELGSAKNDHSLIINATQAAGAFSIDVKAMGIDALCSNSYKWLMSGYGCGFIYVSKKLFLERPAPLIGWFGVEDRESHRNDAFTPLPSAERFNLGSPAFPAIFALGAGIKYLLALGSTAIEERVLALNRYLTNRLQEVGAQVLSPLCPEKYRSAQTLVRLDRPQETVDRLALQGILCTPKPQGMRVATHFFNNHADIDRLVDALKPLL